MIQIRNDLFFAMLAVLTFIALIVIILSFKLYKLSKRFAALLEVRPGVNLEELLLRLAEKGDQLETQVQQLAANQQELKERSKGFIQHLGIVRFNAFEGMGSDLSFSLALMDEEGNGVVLSSLYGRDESRVYGKPLQGGQSSYLLTDEEKEAIRLAQHKRTRNGRTDNR